MKRLTLIVEGDGSSETYTADEVTHLWVSKLFADVDHYEVTPVEALYAMVMVAHDTDRLDDAMYQVMDLRPGPSEEAL